MSDNTSENILFRETENLDDSELQSKLYENIYYEPHNTESTTTNSLMTVQFDSMTNKLNTEQDVMQAATTSASQFLESRSTSKLPNQETTNPVIQDHVNTDDNDGYSESVLATEKKKNNRSSSQEHKLNSTDEDSDSLEVYSKYNVLQKQEKKKLVKKKVDKEMADKSDSDDSIFEVPVPPKPKPLVINLQDSDEEDNLNLRMSKNDTIRSDENSKTITHMPKNIILNCSPVHSPLQTGASSINEIRHLSRNANIEKNLQDKLSKPKNQNTNKNLTHDKTTKNNINCCLKGNTLIANQTSPSIDKSSNRCNMNNLRLADQNQLCNTFLEESCTNNNLITNRKRHLVSKNDESSKEKRRYSSHHIIPQDNGNIVRRKESWNDYIFKPMTDEMKAYYNSTQSHENFDVAELQRNMSNDPRKWGILDEDLMPRPSSKKQRTRFWNVRCGNCRENGHMRYDCSAPRRAVNCYICGEKGHNESRCPKKSCLTCGKKQNTFCQTCEKCRVLYCTMCNSTGHLRKHCPDLWRRYHQTTTMSSVLQDPGNVMKPPSQLHCCNCAKCGHESSTCKEYRWSQHFPTPAAVTSYTCGPRYRLDDTSTSNTRQFAQKVNVSLSSEIENRLVPHDSMDMQHSECSTNAHVLPVSTNELTYGQEAMFLPEEERTVASFTVHNKTNKTNTKEVDFYHVIYYYGKLRNKNNGNVQIMLKNLSDLIRAAGTSIYAKATINSLAKGKVAPDFFKALTDKRIELEVTIGFQTQENNDLTLQIVAIKKNLQEIYNLFLYWVYLPNDEKKYGIDVCLPTNLKRMYNLLSGRRLQIEKQKFKSYKEFVETRGQNLLHLIKDVKKQLTQHNTNKKNRRLRTKLWHLQIRLLMIVNTEPKANDHVHKYYEILNKLEELKGKAFNVQRDSVLFLQLTLLYNHLFVPHTPINAEQTIDRIMKEAEKATGEQQVTTNTSQIQQVCNQSIQPFYADVALPSESSMFHMPQDNFIDSFSMINAHQTAPDVSLLRDDTTNVGLSTNNLDSINHTCDDEVIITYVNDQPKNLQSMIPKIQKKQTKNEKKKRKKERIALKISDSVLISNLINKARAFKLPYMLQAADKLQTRKNNGTLRIHHLNALTKLIVLEKKHQKQVKNNCKSLIESL